MSGLRVAFVFASRGIGGAERSMLRLMARAHPAPFACRVIVPAPPNPVFKEAVSALGVPYHSLPPWDLPGLHRLLLEHQPDVLYLFGRFRTVAWALVGRMAGVRCVVAAERSAANRRSDRLARYMDRHLVTAYVANSSFAANNLREIVGPGGPPIDVVANGVEGATVPPRVFPSAAPPTLLCVGNITSNKGQGVLLEAVRLLRDRYPGISATLVGRDFTRGRFSREVEARGLGGLYTAVGFADDVGPFLERATVAVLPTLQREGMPTSLLEAMRAGVPVVASDVGGVGEIVENGVTGLLVAPGDARGLAYAIDRLLSDIPARVRLATNARQFVLDRHDLAVMVEGHQAAFASALRRARGETAPPETLEPASVAHVTTAAISLRYLLLGQLEAIVDRGYGVTGVSSPGEDAAELPVRGIEHQPVAMTRRLTPLSDLRSLLALYRLMRRERFTIVHAHNPKPGLLAQVAARLARVPVVVNTLHGFYFHDGMNPWVRRFYVAMEKLAARCSDVILSQNEEDVDTAIREGIAPEERIRFLGNGIDLRRFDPASFSPDAGRRVRAGLGIPEDAPVVGFVGRLVAEKGLRDLLEAARLVLERFPATRFLIVGGADREKADAITTEVARVLGVFPACVFAGVRQDMPEVYRAMDVFTLPSYREGFPRAPMEASAMKVPCVVTDIRGCRQAVTHGRNGFLVPAGDSRALAAAILALLRDPVLRRRLGEEGRRRALADFDERRIFATVLGEYERLLHAKGLSRRIPARPAAPAVLEAEQELQVAHR
jgi:glycosyltransferase involved in cell wall biosynthesis